MRTISPSGVANPGRIERLPALLRNRVFCLYFRGSVLSRVNPVVLQNAVPNVGEKTFSMIVLA